MSKGNVWIFNILIITGLFVLFFSIGSLIPPFFAVFGILFLAAGIYIGFKPAGTLRKKEILDNQEISVEDNKDKPNEVSENPNKFIRQSEAPVVEAKIGKNKEEKEEDREKEIEEEIQEEELEEELKVVGMDEELSFEAENEIEEEETESFDGKINRVQGREKKTTRNDLAFIGVGIFLLIISSLLSKLPYIYETFLYLGILFIGIGLYLVIKGILRAEQVIDNWSILIEKGNGKAEDIFIPTEAFIKDSKAPSLKIKRKEMSPGVIRGIFGTSRDFLVVTDKNFRLNPYQIFINARDYGNNLDVSWYMTYRLPFWRALLRFIPGIGAASFALESLDLFDRQDLTAYATICHYSTLDAVGKLMLTLDQDPSKIDRKSKGFLGIS